MKPLAGKIAIITGASAPRGIGCAIAKRLAKDGAAVLLTDIDRDLYINGKAQRYANVALRTAGQSSDVADAVAYLAGPQSAYVTGISFPVAGGVPFGI